MTLEPRQWNLLWRELGAQGDPTLWYRRLTEAYAEPSRHYHDTRHLAECLNELESAAALAKRPACVAMALWFHDAVYDARSATNEEDSAALAVECLTGAQVDGEFVKRVQQLILCTKTHEAGGDSDAALLIDIDLAILGQPPERFWDYERGIRAEYAWVPVATYTEKRTEILARFLQRGVIYRTEYFRLKYEAAARANLQAAIQRLQHPLP